MNPMSLVNTYCGGLELYLGLVNLTLLMVLGEVKNEPPMWRLCP